MDRQGHDDGERHGQRHARTPQAARAGEAQLGQFVAERDGDVLHGVAGRGGDGDGFAAHGRIRTLASAPM